MVLILMYSPLILLPSTTTEANWRELIPEPIPMTAVAGLNSDLGAGFLALSTVSFTGVNNTGLS
jgi:hypothetical protein